MKGFFTTTVIDLNYVIIKINLEFLGWFNIIRYFPLVSIIWNILFIILIHYFGITFIITLSGITVINDDLIIGKY